MRSVLASPVDIFGNMYHCDAMDDEVTRRLDVLEAEIYLYDRVYLVSRGVVNQISTQVYLKSDPITGSVELRYGLGDRLLRPSHDV